MKLTMGPHYLVQEYTGGINGLREMFSGGPDDMNWIFTGTSGIHGSADDARELEFKDGDTDTVTVLVVRPRTCVLLYAGEVEVTREDAEWLADMQSQTACIIMDAFGK